MRPLVLLCSLLSAAALSAAPVGLGVSSLLPKEGTELAPQKSGTCRLAVVAPGELASVGDLLQADLAGDGLALVERTEIDRLLQEHALNRTTARVEQAREVGRLLGADALLLLSRTQSGPMATLEARLVRLSPGIVLETELTRWPVQEAARWSRDLAGRVRARLAGPTAQHAVAISPAHFQPVTGRPADVELAQQAALLAEHGLAGQPGVVVLERASVSDLARERTLLGEKEYWAGSYLLDGSAETPVAGEGPVILTMRLQPAAGGEAKTFRIEGERTELPALVADLLAQLNRALALAAPASTDPRAEAQRYGDEAKDLWQAGLYFPAYQAAETAALLGLRSPEFTLTRLQATLGVLAWQGINFNGGSVQTANWEEAAISRQLGGEGWLRPAEWLGAATQAIALWREAVLVAIEKGDERRAREALNLQQWLLPAVIQSSLLLRMSPIGETTQTERAMLRSGLQQTFEETVAAAGRRHMPAIEAAGTGLYAHFAPVLFSDSAGLRGAWSAMLRHPYSNEAAPAARAAVVDSVLNSSPTLRLTLSQVQTWNGRSVPLELRVPNFAEARPALRALLSEGTSPELQIAVAALDFLSAATREERLAQSKRTFELLKQHRDYFVSNPGVVVLLNSLDVCFMRWMNDAPEFLADPTKPHEYLHGEPMLAFRRELFLALVKTNADPQTTLFLADERWHPAEVASLIFPLQSRLNRMVMGLPDAPNGEAEAAKVRAFIPKDLRTVADYREAPPLKLAHSWKLKGAVPKSEPYQLAMSGLGGTADRVWIFGEDLSRGSGAPPALFEVALPSMQTTRWDLPRETQPPWGMSYPSAQIFADAERVYVVRSHLYFAIGDRRTRKWEVHRDLSPSSVIAAVGDDLFFLVEAEKSHGLMRYSRATRKLDLLASNRRVPAATPLDDPATSVSRVYAESPTQLHVEYARMEKFPNTNEMARMGKGALYTPATGTWTDAAAWDDRESRAKAFLPITEPGVASASRAINAEHWLLPLPRTEMPRAILPIEFATASAEQNSAGSTGTMWYRVPGGYIAAATYDNRLWYLPDGELNRYLDAHAPKVTTADETNRTFRGAQWLFQ